MNKKDNKQIYAIIIMIASILLIFIGMHAGYLITKDPSLDAMSVILSAFSNAANNPFDFKITAEGIKYSLVFLLMGGAAGYMIYLDSVRNIGDMNGREQGSAQWYKNLKDYNKKFTDPIGSPDNNGHKNMILTQDVSLSMESFETKRNNNVLVIGGSGSGKSRFCVKPNILQANCNYIVTDPSGELLASTGHFLEKQGYDIKVFNLVEMAKSDQYNPFNYIRDDLGVLMMINCLIKNTNPDGKSGGDPFWEKSETALLQALCFYLIKYCPKHQQNFTHVMKLLRAAEVDENDSSKKSKLDRMFDEVAIRDPYSIALKQYLTFKMGAGKTLKSILISCSVRLTVFNMRQIENLTKVDTIDLGGMAEGKKALFVIIPAADSTFNFLVSMMYSQLFETLYFIAETQCPGQRLPTHVRFLLDEFANIGQIPEFTKKLATMRKYEISCTVILQNLAQIKSMYKDDWESLVGNCDSLLFLGGQEQTTLKYISEALGKATINVKNRSLSSGKSKSASKSFNKTGRELMTINEIMTMPKDECILIINGLHPFYGKKYDYLKHPNYKYTGDADKKLIYVNNRNNGDPIDQDELEVAYRKHLAMKYAKSEMSRNAKDKIIGEPLDVKEVTNSFGVSEMKDIKKNLSISSPEEIKEIKIKSNTNSSDNKSNKPFTKNDHKDTKPKNNEENNEGSEDEVWTCSSY